jgi:hypothetical protein
MRCFGPSGSRQACRIPATRSRWLIPAPPVPEVEQRGQEDPEPMPSSGKMNVPNAASTFAGPAIR